MNRKFFAVLMAVVVGSAVFTGCSSTNNNSSVPEKVVENTTNANDTTADVNEEEVEYGETDPSPSQELYYVLTDGLELPASMNMDPAILKDTYGIDADTLSSYVAYMPLANISATEISIFELKEGSTAEEVKVGIQKRVDSLLEQWERYLPEQYDLVQNHKVAEKGNYILFVVSEYADTIVERFEATVNN